MSYIGNSPGVASQRVTTTLTATAGQTQFTTQSGYVLGYVDVYLNGAKLVNGSDFEAITGTYITLFAGASAGDVIELISYVPRGLSDGYTKAEADAKFLDVGGDTASGAINLGPDGLVVNTNQLVTKNGNVGIGTANPTDGALTISNPTNQLSVNQGVPAIYGKLNVGHFTNGAFIGTYAGSNTVSDILRFGTGGTERARISSSGDFGVGTASNYSGVKLQAQADRNSLTRITVSNQDPGTSAISSLGIEAFGGGWHLNVPASSTYQNPLIFDFGGTEVARISSAGLIGIGNTSPQEKLHVTNSAGDAAIRITSSVTNGKSYNITSGGGGNYSAGVFAIMDVTGGTTPFAIVNSSVGIGTTAPSAKLTVSIGSATSGTVARFSAPSYDDVYIAAGSSTTSCGIGTVSTSAFNLFVNSSSKVVVLNNGNVGIGVTNPRAPLDLGSQNNRGQVILLGEQSAAARVGFGLDSANAGMRIFTLNLSDQQIEMGGISTSDATTWTRNHRFGIAGGNTWLNEQGGSVSIGTTTSSGLLTLKNPTVSSENVLLAIQQNGVATGTLGKLTYNQSDDTMRLYNTSSYSGGGLIFGTSNVERVRITAGGQLFFGSTAPENLSRWGRALFNYASGSSNATIALQNGTARAANNLYGMLFVDNADESNAAVYVRQTGSNNGADLLFGTNAGTGGAGLGAVTERMRITAGGNVGIGLAPGPDSKLDVAGNITIDSAFSSQYGICFRRGFETSDNLRIYAGDTGLGRTGGLRLSGYDGIAFGTGSNTWQERVRITNAGHMIPAANDTYDLGGVGSAWRNIYTNDLHLNNEGKSGGNDIDGTTGNWTIQEGAEILYIINNKTGKKYSFVLKEVT